MPLTATEVKHAKPQQKPYKLTDGAGMYLLIKPNGGKYWRFKYRYTGKEKVLAVGVYPDVSLAEARNRRATARERLANNVDPGEIKKVEKLTRHLASADSFEAVATEWFNTKQLHRAQSYKDRTQRLLKKRLVSRTGFAAHQSNNRN